MSTPLDPKVLFQDALERPSAERAAFLDAACGGDPALRARVDALLAANELAGTFLSAPGGGAGDNCAPQERAGDRVGHFELREQIGEGGFGIVWMAEQQEPVRRQVALKIVKRGMDTRSVVARFEQERQALALMDHPNIAKVFDGGETAAGRPYFALELVRGMTITAYCDQQHLDARERLLLFVQVCRAVHHAHQKGVIHRDIKPSNVLVTTHDDAPVPKMIDFGIAKAVHRPLTEKTLFTGHQQILGTPEYMSPEQAELTGLDVDTRADIYSLGVLLYELLTGTLPFDLQTLAQKGLMEVLRVIREDEPPKPSTRVSALGENGAAMGKRRRTDLRRLGRLLRGDLDWVVMRSLEKDRARRYGSADELAADIERHLRSEPVHAGPPGMGYRFRKYVLRHRLGVTAGALVAASLVVGLFAAIWGLLKAKEQTSVVTLALNRAAEETKKAESALIRAVEGEATAKKEALRAQMALDFVDYALDSAEYDAFKAQDYWARDLLGDFESQLDSRLRLEPVSEKSVHLLLGPAYPSFTDALRIYRRVFGEQFRDVPDCLYWQAETWRKDTKHWQAVPRLLQEALAVTVASSPVDPKFTCAVQLMLAECLLEDNRFQEAELQFRVALERWSNLANLDGLQKAQCLYLLASALRRQGKSGECDDFLWQARDSMRSAPPLDSWGRVMKAKKVAQTLARFGLTDDSVDMQRKNVAAVTFLTGEGTVPLARIQGDLGLALVQAGTSAESIEVLEESLSILTLRLGRADPRTIDAEEGLAYALQSAGHFEEGVYFWEAALQDRRSLHMSENFEVARTLSGLAHARLAAGRLGEAEETQRELVNMLSNLFGREDEQAILARGRHADVLRRMDRLPEAETLAAAALADTQRASPTGKPVSLAVQTSLLLMLARIQVELGKFDVAESNAKTYLFYHRIDPGARPHCFAETLVGCCRMAQNRFAEAELLLRGSAEKFRPSALYRDYRKFVLLSLIQCYEAMQRTDDAATWRKVLADELRATGR